MQIVEMKIENIQPYANNPRKNDSAVDAVAASIKEFGFKVPIVIDSLGEIVCGHTRFRAAKKLGLQSVPCVIADDLTGEQIKALRLADNRVGEMAEWDDDLLKTEIADIFDIDMKSFGFDIPDLLLSEEKEEPDYKEKTRHAVLNIQNLDKAQYEGVGLYDIPQLEPVRDLPEIKEWIGFNYVLTDNHPEGKAVHFFMDDYQFERIFNQPERYIERLKRYVCVATPDFSPYGDMPHALQIMSHYKKNWVGKFLQENGVTVIPTIRASSDPRSLEWFLDGEPVGGIVLISSMWTGKKGFSEADRNEWNLMVEKLKPKKIFVYGGETEGMKHLVKDGDCVEYIKSFTQKRFGS